MNARKLTLLVAGVLAAGVLTKASADYVIKDANSVTQTVFAYVCATSKICPASVPTNSAGTELATPSNPLRTDPTGMTTQPISATALPLPSGAANSTNQSSIIANQTSVQGSVAPGTAATKSVLGGGVYNATPPTLTNGQQAAFQFTSAGALITSGGGGGGGAITAASGAYASGSISSGAMVDLGSQADAQCGTANGSCSLIALMKYNNTAVGGSIAAGSAIIGKVGIDQTTPGTTNNVALSYGSAAVVDNPCQTVAKNYTPISVTTATTTRIVAPAAAKKTYVCSIVLQAAGADNVGIVEGTGGTCGTATAGVFGGTTAGSGLNLAANEGWSGGNGQAPIMATVGTNVDFCLVTSAATNLAGHITWVQK